MNFSNKRVLELRYHRNLAFLNIALVSFVAIWIAIFLQSNLTIQYKLIISALIINVLILSFLLFFKSEKEIEDRLLIDC